MDISADLTELGRTPVTVVSAGIKSILDIPRTLEYLVRMTQLLFVFQVIILFLNTRLMLGVIHFRIIIIK